MKIHHFPIVNGLPFTIGKWWIFMFCSTFPTSNQWISELREPISIIFGGKESPIPLLYDKSDPKEIWRFWPLWRRKNCQTCCYVSFLRFGLQFQSTFLYKDNIINYTRIIYPWLSRILSLIIKDNHLSRKSFSLINDIILDLFIKDNYPWFMIIWKSRIISLIKSTLVISPELPDGIG